MKGISIDESLKSLAHDRLLLEARIESLFARGSVIPVTTPLEYAEHPTNQAGSRRKRRKTPPLKPEQTEALNRNFEALLTPSFGKKDVVHAMGVDGSTLCRLLQGKGAVQTRRKLAAVLAELHSADFRFDDLIDEDFDVSKVLCQREKHNED